ncbi:MAG TPA: hypothetical protein PLD37_02555 [Usitatibacteraceae bacterium]|jgi:formate dehydrogenase maturation protein FdhE|nr:hypothetical protein [Usitatibacteraceae bacterium]
MDTVSRIRRQGFRKWYERQLIDSHLCFTTCLLCGLVVASCLEAVTLTRFDLPSLAMLALVAGSIVLGVWSWRRYLVVLERAERYGARSSCPACGAYARFEILASGVATEGPYLDPAATPLPQPWIRVKCRGCGEAWRMPE